MKLTVAGLDRSADLGQALRNRAAALAALPPARQPARIPDDLSALDLARAASEDDYLERYLRLARHRDAVGAFDFRIPRKPGLAGRCLARLRAFLWKLLRYQHDRMAFRQHLVNNQLTTALRLEIEARRKDTADLQRRLAALEAGPAGGACSAKPGDGKPCP